MIRAFALLCACLLSATASAEPVSIYVQGDTQTLASNWNATPGEPVWRSMNEALCNRQPDAYIHVGDIVDVETQWLVPERVFRATFDQCGIPVFAVAGNHDYDQRWTRPLETLNRYRTWRGQRSPTLERTFEGRLETFFEPVPGTDNWWIAGLPYVYDSNAVSWVSQQINALPDRHYVIFVRHQCANASGLRTACQSFVAVHPKIRVVIGGHFTGSRRMHWEQDENGVISIYTNHQHLSRESEEIETFGALIDLDPDRGTLAVSAFNPLNGAREYPPGDWFQHNMVQLAPAAAPAEFAVPPKADPLPGLLILGAP